MEYDTKAFFSEHESGEVSGFAIIETDDDLERHRIAEKWERPDDEGGPTWLTYWISADALTERIERDACSYKQQLSDKQFEGIMNLAQEAERRRCQNAA